MLINSTLSVAQPSSRSLVASTSAPWTPLMTTTTTMKRQTLRRRPNVPKRLSTCTVRCEKVGGTGYNMAVVAPTEVTVKAIVTVQRTIGGILANVPIDQDDFADWFGRTLLLELVSSELDPNTGEEWTPISAYAGGSGRKEDEIQYEAKFKVPIGFGEIGAIRVQNEHRKEMFIKNIVLVTNNDEADKVTFACESWVHSKSDNPEMRIFFSTKSYLPSKTPKGLARLRSQDLQSLRGDGTGERKSFERIYDYDVYNDIGNPDNTDGDQARPVLGGSKEFPYPRRCRTGRPRTKNDPHSEKKSATVYVPRDEAFSEVKLLTFGVKTLRSVLHSVVPSVETSIYDSRLGFPYFTAIDSLYDEGVVLPEQKGLSFFRTLVPRLIKAVRDTRENVLLFETPEMIDRDKFSWFRDEEFARQTLAGINPFSIKLLTELPIRSKLDPEIYGPADSLITPQLIEREIKGAMTAQQALEQKKLFILDYHDMFLPYVHKVRELEDTTLYGSRTVFFLTHEGTLMPIAIELTRPTSPLKPQWRRVYTDDWDATSAWLWKLAKVHVCAHDSGYHQLVSHWLRTHCCTEPYIIASNRQLSAMHPIYRLLHPHFRYTMEINALAREFLINADGIIESSFSPGKYSMELSSVAYGLEWRFDMEALPADLIRRGMAVEDPNAEHGLKLTIEDYPFANDGLLIWASIKEWVTDYVNYYYKTPTDISEDSELQEWWLEIRTKGHADKKDEPWWPKLENQDDLIHILTIIIWVTSGHHAAVNFGQYHYAGYFPNRPTIARTNMPDEVKGEAYKNFMKKPEMALMQCFPSQVQATKVMAILDVLSSHSPDEEYMGNKPELVWEAEPAIKAAFERFNGRMKEIEGKIDQINLDENKLNRCGAGIVPYELLKPFSGPGVTGKGIPNSISI